MAKKIYIAILDGYGNIRIKVFPRDNKNDDEWTDKLRIDSNCNWQEIRPTKRNINNLKEAIRKMQKR